MLAAKTVLMVFNIYALNSTNFTISSNETIVGYDDSDHYISADSEDFKENESVEEFIPGNLRDLEEHDGFREPNKIDSTGILYNNNNAVNNVSGISIHVSKRDSEKPAHVVFENPQSIDVAREEVTELNKSTNTKMHDEYYEAREAAKNRVQVKLNMKQTLILNQAILVYALTSSSNQLCRNHSREFQDGLRAFEPWAMKMFDSSSKLQAGILLGNLADFGSYKQCVEIYFKSQYGPITGKHCLLKITPSEKVLKKILSYSNVSENRYKHIKKSFKGATIFWAACIPQSCSSEDAVKHFEKSITNIVEGLEVNISLSDMDCYAKIDDVKPYSKNDKIILYTLLGYLCIIFICTCMDIWYRSINVARTNIIEIFSIYSNVSYLSKYQKEDAKLECLHGIRFISIIYVVFGHKYLMTLFFPSINALEILKWLVEYPSSIILGGTVSVDTFFLMSGSLVAYHFFEHMSKGGKFNYALFAIHRYLRLTPSFAVVIVFYSTFAGRLGSGPIWKKTYASIQKPCEYFWWSSILYIQPYVNPKHLCILQTWYLPCDVQFYLLSPIIMYPLWKWKRFGVFNYFLIYILSVVPGFYMAWINDFEPGMLMDSQLPISEYFPMFYTMPFVRAPTYILGLGFGYILQRTKNTKIRMGKITLICGWLCSFTLIIGVLLAHNYFELESYQNNRLKQSFFIAMHRSTWAVGVIWVIWACRSSYGGPINSFLSAEIFQILGRIVYSIFLIHMPMQFLIWGALKSPIYFSNFECIQRAFGDFCIAMISGYFLTILVEYPCTRFSLHVFKVLMSWILGNSQVKPVEEEGKRNIE